MYSNLVDYINIEAKSWQKVGSSEQWKNIRKKYY
jgi:hypothetical protein